MPEHTPPAKTWIRRDPDPEAVRSIAEGTGVSDTLAGILASRGVRDADAARAFLEPDLARDWRDPDEIPGMPECADAVAAAVRDGADILVFGDFDADGVTAAALAKRGLEALGARVGATVPHRFREGYGLTTPAVERIIGLAPDLVITVDCGISSAVEVATLAEAGIAVVVTDHHEPGEGLPTGVPVCDPKLSDGGFTGLAGAGVALKLVAAVGARLGKPDVWLELTDIAAIGTIGDVVPMLDENRSLVAHGLERLRMHPRAGVAALAAVAGVQPADLASDRVAFGLVPRINAAGRMGDPAEALELLLTDDTAEAMRIAGVLDEYNKLRQAAEADLSEQVMRAAADVFRPDLRAIVLGGESWHDGVKGIVASRVVGVFGMPALLFSISGGEARGSGRSVPGVDLYAAVESAAHLLTRFGGHEAAVGVTLPVERLDEFRDAVTHHLQTLPSELFHPRLTLDADVPLDRIDLEFAAELATLEPHGAENPRPVLSSSGVFMSSARRVGKDRSHLSFQAYDGIASVRAIAFRLAAIERAESHEGAVDVAYHVDADEWQGRRRVQLNVRDISYHAPPADGPAAEFVDELFADSERILARGEYANIGDADSFHTKLAGVSFEGRQDIVARLQPGDALRLVRQPDNEYDTFACAILDPVGEQVGFLNRRLAAELAPAIDQGVAYEVEVSEVTGGEDGKGRGVNVLLTRRGDDDEVLASAEALERREALAALDAAALDDALRAVLIGDRTPHAAQSEALAHLAAGRSVLAVMATGRGKSFIFHAHAARRAIADGAASVFVYPLRALVADQSFHLSQVYRGMGLNVLVLTGETSLGERDEQFARLADGAVDVIMTTPEFLERNVTRFAECGRVGFLVIDEAHHVGLARAGHRPAYSRLGETLDALGGPIVLATTATAGDDVAAAIRESLHIDAVVLDPTVRDNLGVEDRRGASDKPAYVAGLAARGDKVIVYVNSREQSVRIAERIRKASARLAHATAFYNGGMSRAARHAVEHAFREGDITAVVATSAFGEGVNIPDVRDVVLFHLPFNAVEFNQMCGRSGRDGAPARVHLLFGEKDAGVNKLILEGTAPDIEDLRALYAALRARIADADADAIEVTNDDLAADVCKRRRGSRMSDKGASAGIGVFRELGLVRSEGTGSYRRLSLEPAPENKIDITTSIRYAEGLEEAAEFEEFRAWVLTASAAELLATFDRPILPSA